MIDEPVPDGEPSTEPPLVPSAEQPRTVQPDPPRRRTGIVRVALLVYVPVALASIAWLVLKEGIAGFESRAWGPQPGRAVLLGTGVGLMVVGASRVLAAVSTMARRGEEVLSEALGPLTTGACVALALASGIAEELLFRGAIQPALGIVLTSLLFGLAHVPMRRELWAWPLLAAVIGALLGWMATFTHSLAAPVAAHVTINAVNLRFIARRPRAAGPEGPLTPPA